jgi:hypothetical protein
MEAVKQRPVVGDRLVESLAATRRAARLDR